jgi:hypothetical protein
MAKTFPKDTYKSKCQSHPGNNRKQNNGAALRAAGIGIEFDSVGRDADKRKVIRITPPC